MVGVEMSCTEQRFGRGERLKSITLQGEKGLQYSIVITHSKSHYRIGSHCYLKNSLKKEIKKIPYLIMLMFYFSSIIWKDHRYTTENK